MKSEPKNTASDLNLEPIEQHGIVGILTTLLRNPGQILHELLHGKSQSTALALALGGTIALALFGFLLGTFSYGTQLWATPLKLVGGILFSALICFPSLVIFGNLGGLVALPQSLP